MIISNSQASFTKSIQFIERTLSLRNFTGIWSVLAVLIILMFFRVVLNLPYFSYLIFKLLHITLFKKFFATLNLIFIVWISIANCFNKHVSLRLRCISINAENINVCYRINLRYDFCYEIESSKNSVYIVTSLNHLERTAASQNELESPRTSWSKIERAGIRWSQQRLALEL